MRAATLFTATVLTAAGMAAPAGAAVVLAASNVTLTPSPYTVTVGSGSFSFSTISPGSNSRQASVALQTGGSGRVYGNGFLTQGVPDSFQRGTIIPTQLSLGQFFSTSGAQPIPFSIASTYVALSFLIGANTHYGYANVAGSTLVNFAYNDTPGGSIAAGATPAAVPEPASWALLVLGFGLVGALLRRRPAPVLSVHA